METHSTQATFPTFLSLALVFLQDLQSQPFVQNVIVNRALSQRASQSAQQLREESNRTSASPQLHTRTRGSNREGCSSLCSVPEILKLGQGPCTGELGPKARVSGPHVDTKSRGRGPPGAQMEPRPGWALRDLCTLLTYCVALRKSIPLSEPRFPQHITWKAPQMARVPELSGVLREVNVPSRANGTEQSPTAAPSHSWNLRTSRPAKPSPGMEAGQALLLLLSTAHTPATGIEPTLGLAHPDFLPPTTSAFQLLASNGPRPKLSFSPCLSKDPTSGRKIWQGHQTLPTGHNAVALISTTTGGKGELRPTMWGLRNPEISQQALPRGLTGFKKPLSTL